MVVPWELYINLNPGSRLICRRSGSLSLSSPQLNFDISRSVTLHLGCFMLSNYEILWPVAVRQARSEMIVSIVANPAIIGHAIRTSKNPSSACLLLLLSGYPDSSRSEELETLCSRRAIISKVHPLTLYQSLPVPTFIRSFLDLVMFYWHLELQQHFRANGEHILLLCHRTLGGHCQGYTKAIQAA